MVLYKTECVLETYNIQFIMKLTTTKLLIIGIFILFLSVIAWQYFQIEKIKGMQVNKIEEVEKDRIKSIDSIKVVYKEQERKTDSIINYIDSLKLIIQKLTHYVPDNTDLDNASHTELERILTRYYPK